jgi:hypothetical protein
MHIVWRNPDKLPCAKLNILSVYEDTALSCLAIKNFAVFVQVHLYAPAFMKVASEIKNSVKILAMIFHF